MRRASPSLRMNGSNAALVFLLASSMLVPSIRAGQDPFPWEDTPIASWSGEGSHWLAMRIAIGEGRLYFASRAYGVVPLFATGLALYDADGAQLAVWSHATSGARLPYTYAQVGDARVVVPPPVESPFGMVGSGTGLSWGYDGHAPLPTGEYVVVLWSGAPGATWTVEARGNAPFAVVGTQEGPEAYAFTGRDFEGAASAGSESNMEASGVGGVGAPLVGNAGVGARAQVAASVTALVAERFVGSFEARRAFTLLGVHTGVEQLSVENPAELRSCDPACVFDDPIPGAWTFRATGVAVGTADSTQIVVNGAAFRWP